MKKTDSPTTKENGHTPTPKKLKPKVRSRLYIVTTRFTEYMTTNPNPPKGISCSIRPTMHFALTTKPYPDPKGLKKT